MSYYVFMKKDSIGLSILEGLWQTGHMLLYVLPRPFEDKHAWARRLNAADPDSFRHTIRRLKRRGYLEVVKKHNQKFLKLTHSGELSILVQKAGVKKTDKWDGKWRVIIYDIPEESKEKRKLLRYLLKKNHFYKLQASVYITPYPLNREALDYLKVSGLSIFIRIFRVDEMDDEEELVKHFNLLNNTRK